MTEFPTSETTMIRQKAKVPLILNAVKLKIVEQVQDSVLDAFAVELCLAFPLIHETVHFQLSRLKNLFRFLV